MFYSVAGPDEPHESKEAADSGVNAAKTSPAAADSGDTSLDGRRAVQRRVLMRINDNFWTRR